MRLPFFEAYLDQQLRDWNANVKTRRYSVGFMEWIRFKVGFPSDYCSIAEQPFEVFREFDYLIDKYGKTNGNAADTIHQIERAKLLANTKHI